MTEPTVISLYLCNDDWRWVKIIFITLQWQWTPENFFEVSEKGKMIKTPFVFIVRLGRRGHKAQRTVAGRRGVCVLVNPLRGGRQVSLLCRRLHSCCCALQSCFWCCVMPMLPLASASLGGRCRQGQSWPVVPGDRYGGLSGWNLLLSCLGVFGHDFTSPIIFPSLHQLLSVNCWRPVDSVGERYPKRVFQTFWTHTRRCYLKLSL